jgi:hypothetical protein
MHFYSTFHQAGREYEGLFTLPIAGYYFSLASYHFAEDLDINLHERFQDCVLLDFSTL